MPKTFTLQTDPRHPVRAGQIWRDDCGAKMLVGHVADGWVFTKDPRAPKKSPALNETPLAWFSRPGWTLISDPSAAAPPTSYPPVEGAATDRPHKATGTTEGSTMPDASATTSKRSSRKRATAKRDQAKPAQPAAEAPAAAETPAEPQGPDTGGLYKALVARLTEAVDGVVTEDKAAYLRVGVQVGDAKPKTVVYVNHPSAKSVRLEFPRQGSSGYDVLKVQTDGDLDGAVERFKTDAAALVVTSPEGK